jgi:hypothetical protein
MTMLPATPPERPRASAAAGAKAVKPKKPSVVRCYPLPHHGNAGKVAAVAALLRPYQDTMHATQSAHWRAWLSGEDFWNRRSMDDIDSALSERFKRSAQNQVVAGLDSWLALTKTAIKQTIARSSLPPETKADLWWLNASGGHHKRDASVPVWVYDRGGKRLASAERRPAPAETLRLLRNISKHVRAGVVSVPELWHARTMLLDGPVAQVEPAKPGSSFDWWVRLSTTTAGRPVRIPLTNHHHFTNTPGAVAQFAQLTVNPDHSIRVALIKRSEQWGASGEPCR